MATLTPKQGAMNYQAFAAFAEETLPAAGRR
jgi:hypothetical protein